MGSCHVPGPTRRLGKMEGGWGCLESFGGDGEDDDGVVVSLKWNGGPSYSHSVK